MMNNNLIHKTGRRFSPAFFITALFVLSLLMPAWASATEIQVKIDRGNIQLNETFTLTFEATDDVDGDPDFSPLEKDFQVLGQSSGSNISLINGKYTKSLRWNVSLMALKEGTLKIPSINFGKDKSPEYQLKINPVQKSNGKSGEEFISELELSSLSAYPQSQIVVTQRLLSDKNINGYEFSSLKFSGVEVAQEPLGELKQYQTKRGNTPYLVLEQSFALYPQGEGTLEIAPSIASAQVAISNRGNRSPFNSFRSNTKTVRRASEKKSITVKPIPASFKGKHWLPAREVQLVEEFPQNTSFTAGEPITRTLSLFVDGQSASQLPEFTIPEIDKLKQYPDKPLIKDNKSTEGITGSQQIKVAIIPSQSGTYTLPAISIPWWNTKTNKMEIARLAKRTFTVASSASSSSSAPVAAPMIKNNDITNQTNVTEPEATQINVINDTGSGSSAVWKILTLLSSIGWLVTLFLFWKHTRKNPEHKPLTEKSLSLKQTHKQLQHACEKHSAKLCKDALLKWADALFIGQNIFSLGELETRVNSELAQKIRLLNAHLYKNISADWHCEDMLELCFAFEKALKQDTAADNKNQLEPLYQ